MSTPIEEEDRRLICMQSGPSVAVVNYDSGEVVSTFGPLRDDDWPEEFEDHPEMYWYNTTSHTLSFRYFYTVGRFKGRWSEVYVSDDIRSMGRSFRDSFIERSCNK